MQNQLNQKLQDKEVYRWWNLERNLHRWDHDHYSKDNIEIHHVLKRQDVTLDYLDELNLKKGAKVLELGFGGGQMAKRILDKGYEYHGIDISELLVDAASDRCREYVDEGRAHFIAGSIEKKFNLDSGVFDAVLVCGALQYLGSPQNCFKEVSRVLKDNGAFIVCQANMYSLRKMVNIRYMMLKLQNCIMQEEFLYFPCFKSILTDTKLKKYFGIYKEYKWMNSKFMTKGCEIHVYDIKKRMYSYWRLKKILQN